jgi:hypothetical protein
MLSDIHLDRKCVHIKLRKSVHLALRRELLAHGVSMQELFDAVASELVSGNKHALALLERVKEISLERLINGARRVDETPVDELDSEALYKLIERGSARVNTHT